MIYLWARSSLLPQLLPWLIILALLALRPNRCAQAWWIWLPLAVVLAGRTVLERWKWPIPSELVVAIGDTAYTLAFGLAAVWCLAGCVRWQHRGLTFLGFGAVLALISFVAATALTWNGGDTSEATLVLTLLSVLAISLTGGLSGWLCRKRSGLLRISVCYAVVLPVCWAAVLLPQYFSAITQTESVGLIVYLTAVGWGAVLSLALWLPFLVLAFANSFYRQRLEGLLDSKALPLPVMPEAAVTSESIK